MHALPLKAARRDAIAKLKSFIGFRIWSADKLNAVSFRFAMERHVNAA